MTEPAESRERCDRLGGTLVKGDAMPRSLALVLSLALLLAGAPADREDARGA